MPEQLVGEANRLLHRLLLAEVRSELEAALKVARGADRSGEGVGRGHHGGAAGVCLTAPGRLPAPHHVRALPPRLLHDHDPAPLPAVAQRLSALKAVVDKGEEVLTMDPSLFAPPPPRAAWAPPAAAASDAGTSASGSAAGDTAAAPPRPGSTACSRGELHAVVSDEEMAPPEGEPGTPTAVADAAPAASSTAPSSVEGPATASAKEAVGTDRASRQASSSPASAPPPTVSLRMLPTDDGSGLLRVQLAVHTTAGLAASAGAGAAAAASGDGSSSDSEELEEGAGDNLSAVRRMLGLARRLLAAEEAEQARIEKERAEEARARREQQQREKAERERADRERAEK